MIAATAVLSAVRANWKLAAGIGAIAAFVVLVALYRGEKRHSAKLSTRIVELTELRKADRAAYINAQTAAVALNKVQVARIETKSQEITDAVSNDYAGDLQRLRAELGRVRGKGQAAQRVADRAPAGQVGIPAPGVDGAPLPLSPDDLLLAAETELQLSALQDWVERQLAVER